MRDDAMPEATEPETAPTPAVVATLVGNHRDFLAFVERRVGDRALAEEILQDAFVRSLDKVDQIRDSAIGWFYGVLRNAVVDHHRRRATATRRLDAFAAEVEGATEPAGELRDAICACVGRLAGTLKPEYAEALQRVEVEGASVKDFRSRRASRATTPACGCSARARRCAGRSRVRAAPAPTTVASTAPAPRRPPAVAGRTPTETVGSR